LADPLHILPRYFPAAVLHFSGLRFLFHPRHPGCIATTRFLLSAFVSPHPLASWQHDYMIR